MTEISIDRAPGRLAPIPRPAVMAADFTYLVLGLPLGIAAFTIAVTGLALGAGLAITLAGLPILLAHAAGGPRVRRGSSASAPSGCSARRSRAASAR